MVFLLVPDVSLIQEAREERQLTGDSPNSLKAWTAAVAQQFAGKSNLREATKQLDHLVAEHFFLEFYQRPYDMAAEVRLKTLAVEDHVEEDPIPEFRNIVSSEILFSQSQNQRTRKKGG